jgi:hypothetical protein
MIKPSTTLKAYLKVENLTQTALRFSPLALTLHDSTQRVIGSLPLTYMHSSACTAMNDKAKHYLKSLP